MASILLAAILTRERRLMPACAITAAPRVITVTPTLAEAVRDVTFTRHDIDFTRNRSRDWVQVTGVTSLR